MAENQPTNYKVMKLRLVLLLLVVGVVVGRVCARDARTGKA